MSLFIREIIKNKIKNLKKNELLHYAKNYGFTISESEAEHIIYYIQNNDFDVFARKDIELLYKKLTDLTDISTANKAKQLFEQLIKTYGLEDYFN